MAKKLTRRQQAAILAKLLKGFKGSGQTECEVLAEMLQDHIINSTTDKHTDAVAHFDIMLAEVIDCARIMRRELTTLRKRNDYLDIEDFHLDCAHSEGAPIQGGIAVHPLGIAVQFEGYGTAGVEGVSEVVVIEQIDGKPRVVVWADINKEDPTHVIELDGAQLSKWKGDA